MQVTPLQVLPLETPSPYSALFGEGITVSNVNGHAMVNVLDVALPWAVKVAVTLLNSSKMVPVHFTIKGKDVHYFVKPSSKDVETDIERLGGILNDKNPRVDFMSGLNLTIHRHKQHYGINRHEVDIRVHGNHSVLNIRYGTSVDRELRRVLKHAKDRAVNHAWAREQSLLKHNLPSVYHWSEVEIKQIKKNGHVKGYVADYIHQPDKYPELSDDCNNIRFVAEVP